MWWGCEGHGRGWEQGSSVAASRVGVGGWPTAVGWVVWWPAGCWGKVVARVVGGLCLKRKVCPLKLEDFRPF